MGSCESGAEHKIHGSFRWCLNLLEGFSGGFTEEKAFSQNIRDE